MSQIFRLVLRGKFHLWALLLVLLLSGFLNTYNINFPLFFHADEPKKIHFILSGQQDFRHPLLMLQAARLVNAVAGLTDPDRLLILCRMISASLGVLLVLLLYVLSRQGLGKYYALLAALGLAVSPIFVIHAHYFKEDIIFTACSFLSLLCFLKFLKDRTFTATLFWSLATGLALSAQYKGVLLILIYFGFPKVLPEIDRRWFYHHFRIGLVGMALVFLAVNYPLFFNIKIFLSGFANEVGHAVGGHTLHVYPFHHWFSFHLLNSLIPGMSLVVTLLALYGLAITVRHWKKAVEVDKLLFVYTVVFYLAHEISPMKTFPDFMRYMIPIAPTMIYFACKTIYHVTRWIKGFSSMTTVRIVSGMLAAAMVLPLYDTWQLDTHLIDDTRLRAKQWVAATGQKAWGERYTMAEVIRKDILTKVDISEARKSGIAYLVASSFSFERYIIGSQMSWQSQHVYETHKKFVELFSYPYVEIKPTYKTFAYSNPVIRIIDIRDPQKSENQEKSPVTDIQEKSE